MMALQDLQVAAINEIFNNGGTVTDFITPTMATRWLNAAQYTLWQNLVMNDISYWGFYDRILNVPSGMTTPAILTLPEDVHRITSMSFSLNNALGTGRIDVPPLNDPRERSYIVSDTLPISETNPGFAWMEGPPSIGVGPAYGLSGSTNYFIRQIQLVPTPETTGFLYYDGQRLPAEMVELTDIPEVPRDTQDFLVWEAILRADLRDKVFRQEIFKKRDMSLKDAIATHKKGVQGQRTTNVIRRRWS